MPQLRWKVGRTSVANETVGEVRSASDSKGAQTSSPATMPPPESLPVSGLLLDEHAATERHPSEERRRERRFIAATLADARLCARVRRVAPAPPQCRRRHQGE